MPKENIAPISKMNNAPREVQWKQNVQKEKIAVTYAFKKYVVGIVAQHHCVFNTL